MRFSNLSCLSIFVAIVLSACGGGSGGGGDTEVLAKLDAATIDKLGVNAALATPGCAYTSEIVSTALRDDMGGSYRVLINTIKQKTPKVRTAQKVSSLSGTWIGECGGTLVIAGEHDDGNDDLIYTYTDYCVEDTAGSRTVLNGVTNVLFDGHSTPTAPVTDKTVVSTTSSGVAAESLVDGVTSNKTFYLTAFEYTGDDISDADVSAEEIRVTSESSDYRATDILVIASTIAGSTSVEVKEATYHDPDNGTVKISTSAVPVSMGSTGAASITVTGSDGTSATFTTDDISVGFFTAEDAEGAVVGALDCSALTAGL
ncbi:MAG: hypothetical protein HOM14_20055 [Gammaproteobacteria bacterium]|jgi:hypothetical protein|nr:hypothetical protein [Gammaproteobacteria bacterium]MBT3726115.1 hypothetical protein [Gammaproteobacteria bacterium]MBT4194414.1 hypothetical protein [Gammaproteobacteria bacterium]MBT4450686.1 hypothetical protein [Gammaproteobacteria bacterium]MBT4863479.1 hypothetical protein [Gammaproteobacteria bacterium]